ncbi:MAG: hypothetical protein Q4D90_11710 [bacterium]|nr:hypothetical protein [bacterium]
MFEILVLIVTVWLGFKVMGLLFKTAWGIAKLVASLLFAVAVPLLLLCLIFAGGILLLIPALMIAIALGVLKSVL